MATLPAAHRAEASRRLEVHGDGRLSTLGAQGLGEERKHQLAIFIACRLEDHSADIQRGK